VAVDIVIDFALSS